MIRTTLIAFILACTFTLRLAPAAESSAEVLARSPLIAALAPPSGAWSEQSAKPADRAADRARIVATGAKFVTALRTAKDGPAEPAQRAIAAVIDSLSSLERPTRPDLLDPRFARRAVRGGALRGLGADAAAADVEKAVQDSARFLPVVVLAGPAGARLEERRDAFGAGGWVLTGARSAYAVEHSDPQFNPTTALTLTVELPAKADAATDAAKAISATVSADGKVIATWTAKGGRLVADQAAWRAAVPEPQGTGLAKNLLPPHVVLTELDGDIILLATEGGVVVPPRSAKPAETDRFIAEAARVLPDAAHLDLIGQHLFRYVYDSPDPRFPLVIGNHEVKGEVHQTAAQTLGATTGGQCRGDCDDLAELYQTIAEKQGRLGHLLLLPSHTAFAAARKDGTEWIVEVMQTGPTMAFRAASVPEALRATQANFDPAAPFSPDHLGLLLRFSGENTRGPFGLGWRIFAEPAYARIMIDVQRDWQYQTYARAIAKMEKLIAGGDRDPANLHELAALYDVTGQWAAAIKAYNANLAALADPVSKIEVQMELAAVLRRADRTAEARTLLAEVAASLLPLAPKLGDGIVRLGLSVSMAQLAVDDVEGGRTTLKQTAFGPLAGLTSQILQLVTKPGFDPASWSGDSRFAAVRPLIQGYIGCLIAHLAKAPAGDAVKDPMLVTARQIVDAWLAHLAFLEADAPADALQIYASAARVHALDIPADELAKQVAAASLPLDGKHDHRTRKAAPAADSLASDLPWIRISPAWWQSEVGRALRATPEEEQTGIERLDAARIDRPRVATAAAGATAALAACEALGLHGQALERPVHFSQLTAAVIAGDDKRLRELLRFVKKQNDKQLRDVTAITLGSLAPACDERTWQLVLKAWADEVDYKPKWFSIAWTAVVAGAPGHAVTTARMAAARFKDDPSFTEEAAFMEKLLGKAK